MSARLASAAAVAINAPSGERATAPSADDPDATDQEASTRRAEGSIVCGAVAAAKYEGGTPQEVPPGSFDTGAGDETEGAEVPDGAGDAEVAAETEGRAEADATLDDGPGPAQAATTTAMTIQQPRILRMRRL